MGGKWMFRGIERGTLNAFMVVVPDRTKTTLRPGNIIMSDEWAAYHYFSGYLYMTIEAIEGH